MKKAHVAEYKKKIVADFVKLIKDYPVVGALNVENLPAKQFQKMREQLRGKVVIKMTKRRLMKIALEKAKDSKQGIEELEKHLEGMPALIFSAENPFKLNSMLKKSKSRAPIKAGQTAPEDIVIKAGPTPFAPGPIIGELGSIGLKTGVEAGKVSIVRDKVVVKEGEDVPAPVAGVLARLGIMPMEIGLELVAIYENGMVYKKDILKIDDEDYINNIKLSASEAFSLAIYAGYTTKETVEFLIKKAFNESKAVAPDWQVEEEQDATEPALEDQEAEEIKDEPKEEVKLKDLKESEGLELKERVTEESISKTEEFVKQLQQRAEQEKAEETPEEKIPSVDEIVQKTKDFAEGKKAPDAEELLKDSDEELEKEIDEEIDELARQKKEEKREHVPTAHELAQRKRNS